MAGCSVGAVLAGATCFIIHFSCKALPEMMDGLMQTHVLKVR